jgi:hypothetical protein
MPTVNLTTVSGTDYAQAFTYATSVDGGDTTTPVDIGGSVLRLQVRRRATDAEAMVSIGSTDEGGIEITDGPNGKFTVAISRAQLDRIPAGTYVQNLVRTRPDGLYEEIWTGTVTHTTGPTHDRKIEPLP